MKKWLYGILTGIVTLVLLVLIVDLIFGKPLASYWNALIAYFTGYAVYKYFKKSEIRSVNESKVSQDLRQEVDTDITYTNDSKRISHEEEETDYKPYKK